MAMMIQVDKPSLEAALKTVSNTVAAGGSDISTHYLFRGRSGALEVLSSNGRTWSSCPVKGAVVSADTQFTIEAKRVHCLLDSVGPTSPVEFGLEGAEVTVQTDRGRNAFASLDPALFPTWDEQLGAATPTAKILADRLHAAFSHARMFVYDVEAKNPALCVVEFRGGCLYSTDQTAVSIILIPGMEKSELRVSGKDIGNLLSFLAGAKGAEVEIREGERAAFVLRADGAVFGEVRSASRFPNVSVDWKLEDDEVWPIFREELEGNIKFLSAAARWEDTRLRLRREGNDIVMTMAAVSGKDVSLRLKTSGEVKVAEGRKEISSEGFAVSHPYLTQALGSQSGTSARLGVSEKVTAASKGGWLRVRDDRDHGDVYLTTIAWLKKV